MIDFKNYSDIKEKLSILGSSDVLTPLATKFEMCDNFLESRINSSKPSIMVYGLYNAGKSTLVNALLGKEVAPCSDRAETSKVTAYEYAGVKLYDTPGINAPIEHEKVTVEHYKKCDIIIFVLSNGGSVEDKHVYEKIKEIVLDKKPLIIVLNMKVANSDCVLDSCAIQEAKIRENILKLGLDSPEKFYNLISVDAKTGLKAKLENKPALLEYSRLDILDATIKKLINTDNRKTITRNLNKYIVDFAQTVFNFLEKENTKVINSLQNNTINEITAQKLNAKNTLNRIVNEELFDLEGKIIESLSNNNTNIENIINITIGNITDRFTKEISSFSEVMTNTVSKCALEIMKDLNIPHIDSYDSSKETESSSALENTVVNSLKDPVIQENIAQVAEVATKTLLETIKDLLPSLMFGKGPVWIATAASNVARCFGPLLAVVTSIWDLYSSNKEEELAYERERSRVLAINNAARQITSKITQQFQPIVESIVSEVYDKTINEFKARETCSDKKQQEINRISSELNSIITNLPSVD